MDHKSTRDDRLVPGFDSRGIPPYHKHLKRRLLSALGMLRDPEFAASSGILPRDALIRNKAGHPCSDLNAGSSCISKDERMSESPIETTEIDLVAHLIATGGLTSFENSRGRRRSMPQKETMPDSS